MKTLVLSANSLSIYDRCNRAYYNYKVVGRRAVRSAAGLIAGTAIHSAVERLNTGQDVPAQEAAIDETLAETPMPPDDYRSAGFLKDALAAFRAELGGLFVGWKIEEIEEQGELELGVVEYKEPLLGRTKAVIRWEYRRDMVGADPNGRRYVCDYKSASRNEDVEFKASQNSGALMGYCWSWNKQHPDRPVIGAQLVRIIMRKPTRTGVSFEFPKDSPIFFQPERLEEWQRHTLRKAKEILERDPNDPDDWPLACNPVGCCRTQFGACDYLESCCLKPEDRPLHLASDAYESSDHERPAKGAGAVRTVPVQSPTEPQPTNTP